MERCSWVNMKNHLYIKYHDEEWGVPTHSDRDLYELLILESFQAGLSWECVLNKRENFRKALYENKEIEKRKTNISINNFFILRLLYRFISIT